MEMIDMREVFLHGYAVRYYSNCFVYRAYDMKWNNSDKCIREQPL